MYACRMSIEVRIQVNKKLETDKAAELSKWSCCCGRTRIQVEQWNLQRRWARTRWRRKGLRWRRRRHWGGKRVDEARDGVERGLAHDEHEVGAHEAGRGAREPRERHARLEPHALRDQRQDPTSCLFTVHCSCSALRLRKCNARHWKELISHH